jgi:hypothetical protein
MTTFGCVCPSTEGKSFPIITSSDRENKSDPNFLRIHPFEAKNYTSAISENNAKQ